MVMTEKEDGCLFCQIAQGTAPGVKVWESDEFMAIKNKFPDAPIHLLVIPKAHVSKITLANEGVAGFWEKMMAAVFEVVRLQGLNKTGYKLTSLGAGFNHFDHEHIHVMGGSKSLMKGKA